MPMLKPCAPDTERTTVIACLVSSGDLVRLLVGGLGVVGDVAVGADHQVPGRVRVEVEHGVRQLAAAYDQPLVVGQLRDPAERALPRRRVGRLVLAADVGDPVRRPEPVEPVGVADAVLPRDLAGRSMGSHPRGAIVTTLAAWGHRACGPAPPTTPPPSRTSGTAGWHDAHPGHVPDGLTARRTLEAFHDRAPAGSPTPPSPTVDGEVAGFIMVVDDEVEQCTSPPRTAARAGGAAARRGRAPGGRRRSPRRLAGGRRRQRRARAFYEKQGWIDGGDLPYEVTALGHTFSRRAAATSSGSAESVLLEPAAEVGARCPGR